MIQPTVGRVVLFHPGVNVPEADMDRAGGPYAAIIAHVLSDEYVNLAVFDSDGRHHFRTSVRLRQPNAEADDNRFCEWLPYQVGQAAKTEKLQDQLDAHRRATQAADRPVAE